MGGSGVGSQEPLNNSKEEKRRNTMSQKRSKDELASTKKTLESTASTNFTASTYSASKNEDCSGLFADDISEEEIERQIEEFRRKLDAIHSSE